MKYIKKIPFILFVFVFTLLMALPTFIRSQFGELELDQLVFVILGNNAGANFDVVWQYVSHAIPYILFMLVVFIAYFFLAKYEFIIKYKFFNRSGAMTARVTLGKKSTIVLVVLSFSLLFIRYNNDFEIAAYVNNRLNAGKLFEDEYVKPDSVEINFPDKKKNLIYIALESINTGFSSMNLEGYPEPINLLPRLTELSENQTYLKEDEYGNGLKQIKGTTWTIGSLVGQTAGVPLMGPIGLNTFGSNGVFLPGIITIGDILEENGYNNYFAIGSDAAFGGRDVYYSTHGNYELLDLNHWRNIGKVPSDYNVFWGIEDAKLFEYSKEKLLEISKDDTPFNFSMLTVDSHFEDGYTDEACEIKYQEQYANAIECSDYLVVDFIKWIQEQDFYDNTTIVLVADHSTMNGYFIEQSNNNDDMLYNLFLNLDFDVEESKTSGRQATVFDMFPTTLRALNVEIEGNQLGLGVDLFSEYPTLIEQFGYDELTSELSKKSNYYEREFFKNISK